jgi:hypothetical protein
LEHRAASLIFLTRWCSTLFSEAVRVCRPGGYCEILDAVKPVSYWRRPVAALIRRLDRGEFMRSSEELLSLLSRVGEWRSTRLTQAATGLELVGNIGLVVTEGSKVPIWKALSINGLRHGVRSNLLIL